MVRISKLFKGRQAFAGTMFLCLLLYAMTTTLSRHWFVPKNVMSCWDTGYKPQKISDSNIHITNGNIRNVFGAHKSRYDVEAPTVCEFPQVNIYEPSVVAVAGINKTTIHCEGTYLPDLTYITDDNKIMINTSKVENISSLMHCIYRRIFPFEGDDYNVKFSGWSKPFTDSIDLSKDAEFVEVMCASKLSKVVSHNFYTLIPKKEQFDESDFLNLKKREVMVGPKETLSVIMIGMDTLFRNQFIRGCNKTYSYLMESMNSFDLTMHSQVGENTFPNVLALFTGTPVEDVNKWWTYEYHMDNFDLIWRTFENAGYRTLFTQDKPLGGGLIYLSRGFLKPFAMYNSRPIDLAMLVSKELFMRDERCAGNQLDMNFHLDYVRRFLDTFPDKPSFSVAFFAKPTHNNPSDAAMFDEHLLHFYQSLNHKGHLNRSLVVSFSDHGVRYGDLRNSVNGDVESRTPYTILTFPDWFLKKYPDVAANLKLNTKRLTSHFDTYATLLDLLYFRSNIPPPLAPLRHGISLFEKIPSDRTCKDASIPAEFCLCGYKELREINVSSDISQQMVNRVIEALNSKADKNICAVYKLHKIISIHEVTVNIDNTKEKHDTFLYRVKLEVNPGNAKFSATVHTQSNASEFQVGYNINRLSSYKGQSDCVMIPAHALYCYCKNLLSP